MKKIITSLAMITLVATLVVGATRAIFSDTETSFDNTFVAGTLDLKVDGEDDGATVKHVELHNIAPGWTKIYYWTPKNEGSISGELSVEFSAITNKENGRTEPEIVAGDAYGELDGELGQYLRVEFYYSGPTGSGPFAVPGGGTGWNDLNDYGGLSFDYAGAGPGEFTLGPSESGSLSMKVLLPSTVGNIVQSDSVEFDIIFHLDQVTP